MASGSNRGNRSDLSREVSADLQVDQGASLPCSVSVERCRPDEPLRPDGYRVLPARHLVDERLYNEKGNEVFLMKCLDRGVMGRAQTNRHNSVLLPRLVSAVEAAAKASHDDGNRYSTQSQTPAAREGLRGRISLHR